MNGSVARKLADSGYKVEHNEGEFAAMLLGKVWPECWSTASMETKEAAVQNTVIFSARQS